MKIRNKEHQSLGLQELQQLCDEFPNDQMLGEEVRISQYPGGLTSHEPKFPRNTTRRTRSLAQYVQRHEKKSSKIVLNTLHEQRYHSLQYTVWYIDNSISVELYNIRNSV